MAVLGILFWLVLILLAAEASWALLRRHLSPRAAAAAVLPATLVWRLAQVVALLVTGNPVGSGALLKVDPEEGEAGGAVRPPIVGPALVALLPPACVMIALLAVVRWVATPLLAGLQPGAIRVPLDPPQSLPGVWLLVADVARQLYQLTRLIAAMDYRDLWTWVGLYLLACLGLRIVTPRGLLRPALLALLAIGAAGVAVGWLWRGFEDVVRPFEPGVSLVACWELLVLSVIATVSGMIQLGRLLAGREAVPAS